MNVVTLKDFQLFFENGGHVYGHADIGNSIGNKKFLVDSGFSLGIAFPHNYNHALRFSDGFTARMVLADGAVSTAFSFIADATVLSNKQTINGQLSVIFMNGVTEPMFGIEFLKLISPLHIDWQKEFIEWGKNI